MGKIKYSYCLNENNELVHISGVTVEDRHSHTYYCLECGQEMMAKIGKKNKPHFAHRTDTACDGESYLHKLAKRRIREKFMSSDSFPITFVREVPCKESSQCKIFKIYNEYNCQEYDVPIQSDLKKFNGNVVYDTCQEEVNVGEFRPDLLLTGPNKRLKALFIEIYKTHASEEQKLTSNKYKIIETKKIKCEEDIDDILNRGFVEDDNCTTHNFSPKLPAIRLNIEYFNRFILFKSGAAKIFYVECSMLKRKLKNDSLCEMNIGSYISDWVVFFDNKKLNLMQKCLVYLRKKGLQFKNCILCKYNSSNYRGDRFFCNYYKKEFGLLLKQTEALSCDKYEETMVLMNIPLSEFEKHFTVVL